MSCDLKAKHYFGLSKTVWELISETLHTLLYVGLHKQKVDIGLPYMKLTDTCSLLSAAVVSALKVSVVEKVSERNKIALQAAELYPVMEVGH